MEKDFSSLGISEELISALKKQGVTKPTDVQQSAIGVILEKKDAIVRAETGSGKTLTYLLPIFMNIDLSLRSAQCIVLTPTPVSYTHLDVYKRQKQLFVRKKQTLVISQQMLTSTQVKNMLKTTNLV